MVSVHIPLVLLLTYWLASGTIVKFSISDQLTRIVGGNETHIQEFPFQVSLQFEDGHFCGATIVHSLWALTAAHCARVVIEGLTCGVAGATYHRTQGKRHMISKVIVHPDYKGTNNDYDAALLKVSEPFVETDAVKIIELAETTPPAGTPVHVSGWGLLNTDDVNGPDRLHGVDVVVMDHDVCEQIYGPEKFTSNMICAGDPDGKKDSCQGDSGGGLITTDKKLVGIVSWGKECGSKKFPGVYTDVARIRNWVISTIELN